MMRGGSMYFVLWLKKPRNFEGISKDKLKKKRIFTIMIFDKG